MPPKKMAVKKGSDKKSAKASPPMKKAPKEPEKSELELKLDTLETALQADFGDLPTHAILLKMFRPCLETAIDERQPIQAQGVTMVETHLNEVNARLNGMIQEHSTFISTAEKVVAGLHNKKAELEQSLEVLLVNKTNSQALLEEQQARESNAQASVKEAVAFEKSTIAGSKLIATHLTHVTKVQQDNFSVLVRGPAEGQDPVSAKVARGMITEIVKVCKDVLKVDDAMTAALPSALQKKVEDRGHFDQITIVEVEKAIQKWVFDAEYKVRTESERHADASAKVEHAKAVLTKMEEHVATAEGLLDKVNDTIKQVKKGMKEAADELKTFPSKVSRAEDDLAEAELKKTEFGDVVQTFLWLRNRKEYVEPEVATEPEVVDSDLGPMDSSENNFQANGGGVDQVEGVHYQQNGESEVEMQDVAAEPVERLLVEEGEHHTSNPVSANDFEQAQAGPKSNSDVPEVEVIMTGPEADAVAVAEQAVGGLEQVVGTEVITDVLEEGGAQYAGQDYVGMM